MDCQKSIRTRRHVFGAAALGAVLTLSPILVLSSPSGAQAPAVAVTGLARGDRGDSVRTVQQALVNQGISVAGGVDGIFGPGTESALKAFQKSQGLPRSGKVDLATAIALGLKSSPYLGLAQGARGDAVRKMQERLGAAGYRPNGGADGVFGASTRSALESFQGAYGFSRTGVVDAATAAALTKVDVETQASKGDSGTDEPAAEQPTEQPTGQPASAADASSLVGLKIGSRGAAVKTVQQTIMNVGFTVVGGADGIYGALTANAVKSFQNANGLSASGKVDRATAELLVRLAGASGSGSGSTDHDPSSTSSPLQGLRYGSIGSDVKALQEALIAAGISVRGGADGVFGTATQAALQQYQKAKGLEASGKVDRATANALAAPGGGSTATSTLVGLKAGALGNTVKQLQQALIDAGVTVRGGADGIFGPATAEAVKTFQTSQGLEASGKVDQATAKALADPKPAAAAGNGGSGGFAQYGEKGSRVLALQQALVSKGISLRGGVDGDFGGGTSAAVMEFQRQQGLAVTGKIDSSTAAALGLQKMEAPSAPDPSTVELQAFPVQGRCSFGDSWGYPRGGGRVHLGVDIIAAEGQLLYAAADGKIEKVYADYPGSLAGNGVRLRMADGTYFFYAHMQSVADGIDVGVPVKAGQIIGYVGSTGSSGTPHLHFEVHPQGGAAVNPYPLVKAIDGCSRTKPLPQP